MNKTELLSTKKTNEEKRVTLFLRRQGLTTLYSEIIPFTSSAELFHGYNQPLMASRDYPFNKIFSASENFLPLKWIGILLSIAGVVY